MTGASEVSPPEQAAVGRRPGVAVGDQPRGRLLGGPGALGERRRGGVVEGAQHAGDVAQRRGALPAFGQRSCRLAFEIEDHPSGVGPQHLAEVVVAVEADGQAAVADPPDTVEGGSNLGAPLSQRQA